MPRMMRALVSLAPTGLDGLNIGELPQPALGPEDILVRVEAAAINFPDLLIVEDRYQIKPMRPFAPGCEVAGTVVEMGASVKHVRPGDRVIAMVDYGGMAEFVAAPASRVAKIPCDMPAPDAAALFITYGTSLFALQSCARLQRGETLLVLGAGGGVGLAAIELGKAMGARVIAAASSIDKLDLAQLHGADSAIQYPATFADPESVRSWTASLRASLGGSGANVVVDPVGGPYAEPALRAMARQGRYLVVGFAAGIPRVPLNQLLLQSSRLIGVAMGNELNADPTLFQTLVDSLFVHYEAKTIRPPVSRLLSLGNAVDAMRRLKTRQASGKMVIMME